VARTGKWSIFCALQECCPSAVRNDDPYIGKYGMTEIELNKVLEKNSFIKIRDRSSSGTDDQVGERAQSRPPCCCPVASDCVCCHVTGRRQKLGPLPFLKHAVEKPARVD